ncbi:MAG: hypothetical protein R3350_03395, partial [Saprospiraceae bacterium]|nr:hypothetical protein [Saprospiraceae bacterium]
MRSFIVLFMGLSLSWSMYHLEPDETNCRNAQTEQLVFPIDRVSFVEKDLVSGVWITADDETENELVVFESMLRFEESGKAVLSVAGKNGLYHSRFYDWKIEMIRFDPVLTLTGKYGEIERRYVVDQTCQGIELTNTENGETIAYEHQLKKKSEALSEISDALTGKWEIVLASIRLKSTGECPIRDVEMQKAKLHYQFEPNGQFTKALTSPTSEVYLTETGSWELTEDGQYLLLHTVKDGQTLTQT